jgi:hypothetical protein
MEAKLSGSKWVYRFLHPALAISGAIGLGVVGVWCWDYFRGLTIWWQVGLVFASLVAVYTVYESIYEAVMVKDVWIDRNELVIRDRGKEDRVPIEDIAEVEGSMDVRSREKLTWITFRRPTVFGGRIMFPSATSDWSSGQNADVIGLGLLMAKMLETDTGTDRPQRAKSRRDNG